MQVPLQVSFKDVKASEAIENEIRDKASKLEKLFPRIVSCRVVVEQPHKHSKKGTPYRVRIDLSVPGHEVVVNREPDGDVYKAIREAFTAAQRQLQDFAEKRRGAVKTHEEPPLAKVAKLLVDDGYGFLNTLDGREIYFHRNAVVDGSFERLQIGSSVQFVETLGEEGPQASTVKPV